jgi:DNA-binding response OmpR family regulator
MTSKRKVFVIDDDEFIVTILSKALQIEGYDVLAETNTFKNITDKIGAYFPDAVLLDNKLPGMSWLDILKVIKESVIDEPIIMLTADVRNGRKGDEIRRCRLFDQTFQYRGNEDRH